MKKFYVGVKAIIYDPARGVLLLRDPRIWDVPGGRVDDDEQFEETLKRELNEELPNAIVNSIGELLGTYRVHATIPDPIELSDEHIEYRWVKKVEEIPADGVNDEIRRIMSELIS